MELPDYTLVHDEPSLTLVLMRTPAPASDEDADDVTTDMRVVVWIGDEEDGE